MPKSIISLLLLSCVLAHAQYPYVKKLSYPDQLPTQIVYDMVSDSKGYIWIGTDKGLYRFNGKSFVPIPFDQTSSKGVSYLQEDNEGVLWCMNFFNQLFCVKADTLRQYKLDGKMIKEGPSFNNLIVGADKIWIHSFINVFEIDKKSHRIEKINTPPFQYDQVIASAMFENKFYAFSGAGYMLSDIRGKREWDSAGGFCSNIRVISGKESMIALSVGLQRCPPVEFAKGKRTTLKPIDIPEDVYFFNGVEINAKEHWLCTQNGAYQWNIETGETKCYLPNQRVTDIVKDYQGNYWISTLDDGIFICPSLANTLIKMYNDPLLDNFTKLQLLPKGEIVGGNSQGLLSRFNLEDREVFYYHLSISKEIEFINYDTTKRLLITNRGIFKTDLKDPLDLFDFSKGAQRDKFGNIIFSAFNGAYVVNNDYLQIHRTPVLSCPLYKAIGEDKNLVYGFNYALSLRKKRSLAVLTARNKQWFWVSYEDNLYKYDYEGKIDILKDANGEPVIAKSLLELTEGGLAAGTANKGVMVFRKDSVIKIFNEKNGLSANNVRKIVQQGPYIWVLTDAGLDRIDETTGIITNYLDEYGLSNIIINDFAVLDNKLLFATPAGILLRYNLPKYSNFEIKFPLLRAYSNGTEIAEGEQLPKDGRDISFYFEALHYISPNTILYKYRLKGVDTVWRTVSSFNNQLFFSQLSPGKYQFEIQAYAGSSYKSTIRSISFVVPKQFWQKAWFLLLTVISISLLAWLILRQWEVNLIKRQTVKEQLLKSQLVALRAQMNPHFLYNVLNTVQGLVYGNRKAEAGALLGNFSDLMRKTLHSSDKQLLPLKDEIENIRLYLELEKARFDEGFEYHIGIINMEDLSGIEVPSLLLQPFIENAVKHGLMHKRGTKRVDIKFEQKPEGLAVTIEDNGIGRLQSMEINQRTKTKPSSFATAAISERMNLFNSLYKHKIVYEIIDKTDERKNATGTKVVLLIPDYSDDPQAL